jgi:hypothetical protein
VVFPPSGLSDKFLCPFLIPYTLCNISLQFHHSYRDHSKNIRCRIVRHSSILPSYIAQPPVTFGTSVAWEVRQPPWCPYVLQIFWATAFRLSVKRVYTNGSYGHAYVCEDQSFNYRLIKFIWRYFMPNSELFSSFGGNVTCSSLIP